MSRLDPTERRVVSILPRKNVKRWGVVRDDHIEHGASCRRCGEHFSSPDFLRIKAFENKHEKCTGEGVVY